MRNGRNEYSSSTKEGQGYTGGIQGRGDSDRRIFQLQWGRSNSPEGAKVYLVKTADDMRAAAAELLLLADWFAERPVAP